MRPTPPASDNPGRVARAFGLMWRGFPRPIHFEQRLRRGRRACPIVRVTRVRVLLYFEKGTDGHFVTADPAPAASAVGPAPRRETRLEVAAGPAHTGKGALEVPGSGATVVAVKLSSLLDGDLPGRWTMAGG